MPHLLLLSIIYLSFISLGLPDSVFGVAWPAIRRDFGQPLAAVGIITMVMTISAVVSSFCSNWISKHIGTGVIVAASCLFTALALLGASVAPSFAWLVVLAVPLGLGAGAVDASLNHFVAQHYSSKHMNWLHGFWGVGATLGPLVMGAALASSAGWRGGVQAIGLMQMTLAVVLWLTLRLWSAETAIAPPQNDAHASATSQSVNPWAPWLAPMIFFFYVAAEIGTGLWAASILTDGRGMQAAQASVGVSLYFGAITAGRFALGLVANRLGNRLLVRLGIVVAACGAALFALPGLPHAASLAGLVLMGLGCAPIFPSLVHETTRRFAPELARTVIGRQMGFAYLGGFAMPAALGLLATWAGLNMVMPAVLALLLAVLAASELLNRMTPEISTKKPPMPAPNMRKQL